MARPTTEMQIRSSGDPITLPQEQRYPLDLMRRNSELHDRYLESNSRMWDVDGDVRWATLDAAAHTTAAAEAAGYVWSWQAWVSFRDITTCEAMLVRSCLERDVAADLKFCQATRASERAAAADAGAQIAARLGGYRDRPATVELETLFDTDMVRRVLHEGVDLDALLVAHFALVPAVDRAVAEARLASSKEPAVTDVLQHVVDDLRRQETWAWTYLHGQLPTRTHDSLDGIGRNLAEVLAGDLLLGARWPALIDPNLPGVDSVIAAEELAADSGLGGLAAAQQVHVVDTALAASIDRLGALGVPVSEAHAAISKLVRHTG